MMESGAFALGGAVVPGDAGQTGQQMHGMAARKPSGGIGTASFLKVILEKADDRGAALPSPTKASVRGPTMWCPKASPRRSPKRCAT